MKILYCTDFTHASEYSFEKAKPFLKPGCEIDIISVTELGYSHITIYKERKLKNLENLKTDLESQGYTVSKTLSPIGNPPDEILNRINEEDYDFIIIGSRSNVLFKWIGSTSRKVAEKSHIPVFVTRKKSESESPESAKDVLFTLDGSENAYNAMTKALGSLDLTDSTIEVVTVKQGMEGLPIEIIADKEWLERILAIQEENAQEVIGHATQIIEEKGFKVDSRTTLTGDPATEIIKYAEHQEKELIVMGSHGREGISQLLLGSVSRRVLDNTFSSVFVVPMKRS